jgi:hypothetical protein
MGHQDTFDEVFVKYYASNIVGVDLPSLVRGRDEDQEFVDFARCVTYGRDLNAPKAHGSSINDPRPYISKTERESLKKRKPLSHDPRKLAEGRPGREESSILCQSSTALEPLGKQCCSTR